MCSRNLIIPRSSEKLKEQANILWMHDLVTYANMIVKSWYTATS